MQPNEFSKRIMDEIRDHVNSLDPKQALETIFTIDNELYQLSGQTSIRYGNGVHSKHRHINYHKFFMDNINSGESVLDIGSSKGELSADIAKAAHPGKVTGIEIEQSRYEAAVAGNNSENLTFVHGDATKDLPDQHFDVITLSNVLEHIEDRPGLLRKLNQKYHPHRFLIRVPLFERDWRVPLKKELGMDYRLDDTHFIEYTQETFADELDQAGLKTEKLDVRWGEIWAVIVSK